jgi:hypothetical protein
VSTFLLRKGYVTEDALTGLLADIAAWWPDEAICLLRRARRFDGAKIGEPLGLDDRHVGELTVVPWPRWRSGEPDLVFEFRREGRCSLIVIEAKLGGVKSSTDDADVAREDGASRDQLAKYFNDAAHGRDRSSAPRPDRVDVVYLTHHPSAPMEDLEESYRAMRGVGGGGLYWLSWWDVARTVQLELETAEGARGRGLASFNAVLDQAGFGCFRGTWCPANVSAPPPSPRRVFFTPTFIWRGSGRIAAAPELVFFKRGAPA